MKYHTYRAVIIGDSFNNTLGLIRSLGEAKVNIILLLVGNTDRLYVSKSKYLKQKQIFRLANISDCLPVLQQTADETKNQIIICTNDKAAQFIDLHERELSKNYITPMRGAQLGVLMNKDYQCKLANACEFTVPQSFVYNRNTIFPKSSNYPLLLKPINSNHGEKSDIHICRNYGEVKNSLEVSSSCTDFIVQEYIEKEYEINVIGVSTDHGIYIPGGIRKIRHYPTIYSPCSFGIFQSIEKLNVDTVPIIKLISQVGYHGPFSVELLHKGNKNYFMEVNFRNDGLAYVATASGANLPALLFEANKPTNFHVKDTYMMDVSIDYCHVKDGSISKRQWLFDFFKTGCQLNFNYKDPMPTIYYYIHKLKSRFQT